MVVRRIVVALAVIGGAMGAFASPSDAGQIGTSRPFRVEGTLASLNGSVADISPVTGGTPNMARWIEEGRSFRIDVGAAVAQASPGSWSPRYACGYDDFAPVDVCVVGTAMEILGHVEDRGPLGDEFIAEVIRPVSGYGNSTFATHRIALTDSEEDDYGVEYFGTVLSGPLAGFKVTMTIYCTAFGFDDASWVLSRYGNTLSGSNYDATQRPLIQFDDNGPSPYASGSVSGGSGRLSGASGASRLSVEPDLGDSTLCDVSKVLTLVTELREGSPRL